MAPVAARLSLGLDVSQLGAPRQGLVELSEPEVRILPNKIEGRVRSIDSFGNLVTDITSEMLEGAPTDERTQIHCDEHETQGIFRAYSDQPEMTLMALVGSSGFVELAIVGDSAALMLGVGVGTPGDDSMVEPVARRVPAQSIAETGAAPVAPNRATLEEWDREHVWHALHADGRIRAAVNRTRQWLHPLRRRRARVHRRREQPVVQYPRSWPSAHRRLDSRAACQGGPHDATRRIEFDNRPAGPAIGRACAGRLAPRLLF